MPAGYPMELKAHTDDATREEAQGSDSEDEMVLNGDEGLLEKHTVDGDPEAQLAPKRPIMSAAEYRIPTKTKYIYLAIYFILNLALTIYNKYILGKFAFPWLLTTTHTAITALGCYILLLWGTFKMTRLTRQENLVLLAFSLLYTVNIAISNVSLAMVSMPFHQILRSTCPVVTVLIYRIHYARSYSTATYLSLIPLIFGVGLTTYGDYYFTRLGFLLTSFGVLLASLKTIASNRLMTGTLALPALEILLRMSPLAAVQSLLYSVSTGEAREFLVYVNAGHLTFIYMLTLAGNGILAFFLSVASLHTNKLAGALTMTVCANLKQCLTVLLGIVLFHVRVGVLNGCGMFVTLVGAGIYSKVELSSKEKTRFGVATDDRVKPVGKTPGGCSFGATIPVNMLGNRLLLNGRALFTVLGALVLLITLIAAFYKSPRVKARSLGRDPDAGFFHLLIPVNSFEVNTCKAVLSAALLGYPIPTLVTSANDHGDSNSEPSKLHQSNIPGVLSYLNGLGSERDEDLVLLADGHNTWFQLRPEVLLQRYRRIIRYGNERTRRQIGRAMDTGSIGQEIVFSAQKMCWPGQPEDKHCYAIPESPLPNNIYGPDTDTEIDEDFDTKFNRRQRYLNAGIIMGPVAKLRVLFEHASERLVGSTRAESDQLIFARIFGEQEYQRGIMRARHMPFQERLRKWWMGTKTLSNFDSHLKRKSLPSALGSSCEFGIGLDYESSLAQATVFADVDSEWIHFDEKFGIHAADSTLNVSNVRTKGLQNDIAGSLPPFWTLNGLRLQLPNHLTWNMVSLYTNLWTGVTPVMIQHHPRLDGHPGLKETGWNRTWFQPYARTLLDGKVGSPYGPVAVETGAYRKAWWTPNERDREAFGVRSHGADDQWVQFDELCPESQQEELFNDGKGRWQEPNY